MDIAVTSDGGIVVTGQSMNPDSTWSYVTVNYVMQEFLMPGALVVHELSSIHLEFSFFLFNLATDKLK
jgi:hypothetical protein